MGHDLRVLGESDTPFVLDLLQMKHGGFVVRQDRTVRHGLTECQTMAPNERVDRVSPDTSGVGETNSGPCIWEGESDVLLVDVAEGLSVLRVKQLRVSCK